MLPGQPERRGPTSATAQRSLRSAPERRCQRSVRVSRCRRERWSSDELRDQDGPRATNRGVEASIADRFRRQAVGDPPGFGAVRFGTVRVLGRAQCPRAPPRGASHGPPHRSGRPGRPDPWCPPAGGDRGGGQDRSGVGHRPSRAVPGSRRPCGGAPRPCRHQGGGHRAAEPGSPRRRPPEDNGPVAGGPGGSGRHRRRGRPPPGPGRGRVPGHLEGGGRAVRGPGGQRTRGCPRRPGGRLRAS